MFGKTLFRLWQVFGTTEAPTSGPFTEPLPYRAWKWLWQQAPSTRTPNLFERLETTDWDVLILLDACRYDMLSDVAADGVVGHARSPASATEEFLEKAASAAVFEDTVYVSANPNSDRISPSPNCQHVSVNESGWDDSLATVPPENVYDVARDYVGGDRPVVAHTLQPHYPHICEIDGHTMPVPGGAHPRFFRQEWYHKAKLQAMLANDLLDLDTVRRSYVASVRFAWRKASKFAAELVDEGHRVVVTADHGELFGQRGLVEHPVGVHVRPLVRVPWVVFEPAQDVEAPETISDRLAALGYAEE